MIFLKDESFFYSHNECIGNRNNAAVCLADVNGTERNEKNKPNDHSEKAWEGKKKQLPINWIEWKSIENKLYGKRVRREHAVAASPLRNFQRIRQVSRLRVCFISQRTKIAGKYCFIFFVPFSAQIEFRKCFLRKLLKLNDFTKWEFAFTLWNEKIIYVNCKARSCWKKNCLIQSAFYEMSRFNFARH